MLLMDVNRLHQLPNRDAIFSLIGRSFRGDVPRPAG